MTLVRRQFLQIAGAIATAPSLVRTAFAQAPPAGPKLTQILKKDLDGQGNRVEETIVSTVEFGPGTAAPWHMHPSAQEVLYVLEGNLIVELEGHGPVPLKLGETYVFPADVPHLARNDSPSGGARALVVHSRGAKDKPFVVLVKR